MEQKTKTSWNRKDLDVSLIKELYLKEKLSTCEIADRIKVSRNTIVKRLLEQGVKIRDKNEAMSSIRTKELISLKTKGLKRSKEFGEKISQALKGVPKSVEHRRKIGLKSKLYRASEETKRKQSEFRINYIKENPSEIQRLKDNRAKQVFPLKDSTIEIILQNFLKQLGFEFSTHNYMDIEHAYQCDIFVPSLNLILEADGDYWHSNPAIYDKPNERQLRKIEEDNFRTKELKEAGFRVLRLWETEIRSMDSQGLIERILQVIKEEEDLKN